MTEENKGYGLGEVPTNFEKVLVFNGHIVDKDSLIVLIANSLREAGILKDPELPKEKTEEKKE